MKEKHAKTVSIMQKELYDLRQEKKNTKLENRLSKNSSNSSKPSSIDGFNKIVHGLRKKSSDPIGG